MGRWLAWLMWLTATAAAADAGAPLLLIEVPDDVAALAGAEARLRAQLADRVIDATRTRALLAEARALGLRCARLDEQCAAGFGQLAGVDEVIAIETLRRGEGVVAIARRVEAKSAHVVDTSVGRLALVDDDGGVDLEVVARNLWSHPRLPAPVPVEVRLDDGSAPTGLVIDGVRRRVESGGVVWLAPGPHRVGVADGPPTVVDVGSHGLPPPIVVAAALQPEGRDAAGSAAAAAPPGEGGVGAAVGPPWGAVAAGGLGVALVGALVVAGAEAWLASEAASTGRLAAGERILGQGVGAAGAVVAGVGIIGAFGGATLWWSGP